MSNEKRRVVDGVMGEVKKMMDATRKELGGMQGDPIGSNPRSPKERRQFYDRLMKLSPEQRNNVLNEQFKISGHKGMEYDGCDTCKFLGEGFSGK